MVTTATLITIHMTQWVHSDGITIVTNIFLVTVGLSLPYKLALIIKSAFMTNLGHCTCYLVMWSTYTHYKTILQSFTMFMDGCGFVDLLVLKIVSLILGKNFFIYTRHTTWKWTFRWISHKTKWRSIQQTREVQVLDVNTFYTSQIFSYWNKTNCMSHQNTMLHT